MVITVYADRREHDVPGIAESLAAAVGDAAQPRQVSLYLDRVSAAERPRRRRGTPLRRALPANPVPALSSAAEGADVTILGVWGPVTEQVLTAFDLSFLVLLLTDSAVASLRAAQRTLKLCASLGFGADRIAVVRLMDAGEGEMDEPVIAAALKREIFASLPVVHQTEAYRQLASRLLAAVNKG